MRNEKKQAKHPSLKPGQLWMYHDHTAGNACSGGCSFSMILKLTRGDADLLVSSLGGEVKRVKYSQRKFIIFKDRWELISG